MQKISDFLKNYRGNKLLAILPHPDDASFVAGGLFQVLEKLEIQTKIICVTSHGKKEEIISSFNILGVDSYNCLKFEYGKLIGTKSRWRDEIKKEIKEFKPDIVLTFDPHGITGHPDHIVTSLTVLSVLRKMKTRPKLIWRIADDAERKSFDVGHSFHINITPTFKHNLSVMQSLKKLKSIYSHQSKFNSLIFKMRIMEWYLFDHKELYYLVDFKRDKFNLEIK